MATLISYDISGQHTAFKAKLTALGYKDSIMGSSICYLPNTTLVHDNRTLDQARQDARNAAAQLGVTLERYVGVSFDNWAGITGSSHVKLSV